MRARSGKSKSKYRQVCWQPLRAARDYCLWCCAGRIPEVAACPVEDCPLHRFRAGGVAGDDSAALKAVRRKCIDCMAGSPLEVKKCTSRECPLWDFRSGANPYFTFSSR